MKKKILNSIIIILLLLLIYITNINGIQKKIILFEGEKLKINTLFGINIENIENYESLQTSGNLNQNKIKDNIKKINANVNLFGKIPLKEISINIIPKTKVVPVGNVIGLKLYTNGVLVVGMSEIENINKEKYKPYQNSGIEQGDTIISINQNETTCTAELINTVNNSLGKDLNIKYVRNGEVYTTNIKPVKTEKNQYKLGLWVRDTAAGVGTMSFYEPSTGSFAALGHGILDIDTGELINIAKGELITTEILSIKKGEKGTPGEIKGTITNQNSVGQISKNTKFGIFGSLVNTAALNINKKDELEVALRNEIKTGEAQIICMLQNGIKEQYNVEIEKIYKNNNENNKSMIVKITDKRLLEKTGGIIQGMSGSPIIQNGKLIGVLTHVLVNDPSMGYGIFADLMIKQMKEVE